MQFQRQEYWYYVGQGGEVSNETEFKEKAALSVRDKKPEQEMVTALAGPHGPLGAGAMPRIGRTSETGEKNIMDAMNDGTATKPKKVKEKKNKDQKAEEIGPKTKKQEAMDKKDEILEHATEARKYSLALKDMNYSGELVQGMKAFSTKMENVYEKIGRMVADDVDDDDRWDQLLDIVDSQMKWYIPAEAGSRTSTSAKKTRKTNHRDFAKQIIKNSWIKTKDFFNH